MNKIIKFRREKILKYVKSQNSSPLIFLNGKELVLINRKKESLKDIILRVIELSEYYNSYTLDKLRTCWSGRSRSSLDIWRHIISEFPDITIFQVMEELYKLVMEGKIHCQYCYTVRRLVFWKAFYSSYLDNYTKSWEYKISFSSWKNLH